MTVRYEIGVSKREARRKMKDLGHVPSVFQRLGPRLRASRCTNCKRYGYVAWDREGTIELSGRALEEACVFSKRKDTV